MNRHYDLEDGLSLIATITDEGVIFDLYLEDELIGTVGRMADEWVHALFPEISE